MNGKRLYIIAALTAAVAMVLIVPVYAFTTSVSVNDNTVTSNERVVDIENQTTAFSITPPTFENRDTPVWITNKPFELVADDDVKMRAWLYLSEPSGWLILDHVVLKVYNITDSSEETYTFGEDEITATGTEEARYQSTIPTDSITFDPDKEYKFDLGFFFKGLVGESLYNIYRGNLAGNIAFAIAEEDPLTPDA